MKRDRAFSLLLEPQGCCFWSLRAAASGAALLLFLELHCCSSGAPGLLFLEPQGCCFWLLFGVSGLCWSWAMCRAAASALGEPGLELGHWHTEQGEQGLTPFPVSFPACKQLAWCYFYPCWKDWHANFLCQMVFLSLCSILGSASLPGSLQQGNPWLQCQGGSPFHGRCICSPC